MHVIKRSINFYLAIVKSFCKIVPKFLLDYLVFWSPVFLFTSLQPLADWIENSPQVFLSDLILPLILSFAASTILAIMFYWFSIRNRFVGLIYTLGAYYLISHRIDTKLHPLWNFFRLVGLFPKTFDSFGSFIYFFLLAFLFIVILFLLFRLIDKLTKARKWNTNVFYRGIVITVSVAFLIQFFTTLRIMIIEWPQFFHRPPELAQNAAVAGSNKPDIYYIVLDRYTNQNVLKDQFNFDNSSFINFLGNNGFSVDPNAYDSYPNTATSISSTLKADYHTDLTKKFSSDSEQTYEVYHNAARFSPVIEELKKNGYLYYEIGSWYEVTNQAPLADYYYMPGSQLTVFNHTFTLNNFPNNELSKSLFINLAEHGLKFGNSTILSYQDIKQPDWPIYKMKKLDEIADGAAGSRFIFAHILVPHPPYSFNADGSLSDYPETNSVGKPIKDKYVGQIEFVNNQMKDLIEKIKQKSNNQAVIILQSDEGPYPSIINGTGNDLQTKKHASLIESVSNRIKGLFNKIMQRADNQNNNSTIGAELSQEDKEKKLEQDLKMKYGILAAYDIPRAKSEDIKLGGDSVNIFRLVLNTYFGYNLPYLPKCHYAFIDEQDNLFKYSNIDTKLTGTTDSNCP